MESYRLRNLADGGTVYQVSLRMFTPEGTLARATGLLPHIAETGAAAVYLCPVVEADGDTRREFWSDRQKKSGSGNPRNSYRMRDFYRIDPEYGNDGDLKKFVEKSHELGLRVLLDLVYFHCGPTSTMIDLDPEFVDRDENGNVLPGHWHFPTLNYKSRKLREYLFGNMEYFIQKFDVDGYRCDVGGSMPLDFWEEARGRINALKADLYMINEAEGVAADFNLAYDSAYGFSFFHGLCGLMTGKKTLAELDEIIKLQHENLGLGRVLRGFNNHDISTDAPELYYVADPKIDAALVLCYTMDGIPFLYNGQEICDHNQHQMFYSAGKGYGVDWSQALTSAGKHRMELLRKLTGMRRDNPEFFKSSYRRLETNGNTMAFVRGDRTLVVISFDDKPAVFELAAKSSPSELSLSEHCVISGNGENRKFELAPFGWAVLKFDGAL